LCIYRPGTGKIWFLKNDPDKGWFPTFQSNLAGLGGYDLKDPADRGYAFDYDSSGKMDHIVFYRPGHGCFFIIKHNGGGNFTALVAEGSLGFSGFDLRMSTDSSFAYDWDHSGKKNAVVFYRPGYGTFWIVQRLASGAWNPVITSDTGIGGFDLRNVLDSAFAFDYDNVGRQDYIVLYRANGRGMISILKHDS
jgi:hypothetical protein